MLSRLSWYLPGPEHEKFHVEQSRFRLLRGANQTGKTWAVAVEVWWHLLGNHPYRDVVTPNRGMILIADLQNMYGAFCKKLRDFEPSNDLDSDTKYDAVKGYSYRGQRAIRMRNGSVAIFRGGEGQVIALASETLDWGAFDEPLVIELPETELREAPASGYRLKIFARRTARTSVLIE